MPNEYDPRNANVRCANNELAGLRRKLRRLTERVDVLESPL